MTDRKYAAASVRQLAAVVEEVAPRDRARWDGRRPVPAAAGSWAQVSRQRADQLWMVVGMLDRAVAREEMPPGAARRAAWIFTDQALAAFWDLAVAGELRAWAKDVGRPLPLATRRIVRDVLVFLGGLVVPDRRLWLPQVPEPAPRATSSRQQEVELFRFLVGLAGREPLPNRKSRASALVWVRTLAMTGVALDTRSRAGELAAMRMADLGPGCTSVVVRRRPQNGAHLEEESLEVTLSEPTSVALRRWQQAREGLVYSLEGAADALWVSVVPSNQGEPPGLPLSAHWIGSCYRRGAEVVNLAMAGREGWEPLPVRLEGLRRAWQLPEEVARREARAAREAEARAARPKKRRGRPVLPVQHGRDYTYTMLGCRCDECRESATNARRARRQSV